MSDYIYRPPPPPPPPPSNSRTGVNRGGYNSQCDIGGNRGDRGGGRERGGNFNAGRGGGGRGRSSSNYQQMENRAGYTQYNPQFAPQRQPHPLPQFPPQTYFNPAFQAQQQQSYPNHFFNNNPTYTNPQRQQQQQQQQQQKQWQPPPSQSNPYLSYSQEQYQPQAQLPPEPQSQALLPPSESYVAAQSGWPSQSSYGHFTPPLRLRAALPPRKQQQRRDDKPDMDEETWLSLNGGKLLGTNIAPPETPEEIEAWIAQRRARFPTARKIAEEVEKKEAADKARDEAHKASAQREPQAHTSKKRKRPTTDPSDGVPLAGPGADNDYNSNASDPGDDAPPEAASSKTKSTLPNAPTTGRRPEVKKKSPMVCKSFAQRGRCLRGDGCRFRHEKKEQGKRREGGRKEGEERKTLYQRLVEHDRGKENTLMLQVVQYLIDKGKLQEETTQVEQTQA